MDNSKAIKKVFLATVKIAKHFDLIGGKLIAGDSTKFRAQNSKKNNFNQKKIDRHIAYIDNKLDEYNKKLFEVDGDKKEQIKKEIENQNRHKNKYNKVEVLIFVFLAIYRQIRAKFSQFNVGIFFNNIFAHYYYARLNRLVFD